MWEVVADLNRKTASDSGRPQLLKGRFDKHLEEDLSYEATWGKALTEGAAKGISPKMWGAQHG